MGRDHIQLQQWLAITCATEDALQCRSSLISGPITRSGSSLEVATGR